MSNLPPGVSESDIPGNGPEDAAWEALLDEIADDGNKRGLSAADARSLWKLALTFEPEYFAATRRAYDAGFAEGRLDGAAEIR